MFVLLSLFTVTFTFVAEQLYLKLVLLAVSFLGLGQMIAMLMTVFKRLVSVCMDKRVSVLHYSVLNARSIFWALRPTATSATVRCRWIWSTAWTPTPRQTVSMILWPCCQAGQSSTLCSPSTSTLTSASPSTSRKEVGPWAVIDSVWKMLV